MLRDDQRRVAAQGTDPGPEAGDREALDLRNQERVEWKEEEEKRGKKRRKEEKEKAAFCVFSLFSPPHLPPLQFKSNDNDEQKGAERQKTTSKQV